jgi:hypothetical protein
VSMILINSVTAFGSGFQSAERSREENRWCLLLGSHCLQTRLQAARVGGWEHEASMMHSASSIGKDIGMSREAGWMEVCGRPGRALEIMISKQRNKTWHEHHL